MKKFVIATNNKKKLIELNRILLPLGINAVTAKDIGVDLGDVEENGTTFEENAYIKAKSAYELLNGKYCVVADDSGLCVDYLDGAPGIYSARYAGENATDAQLIDKLLSELDGVAIEDRKAHFVCSICCILDDGSKITAQGYQHGYIGFEPVGDGGFGYDPVFMIGDKSYAQLTPEQKDSHSHRGNALRLFRDKLVDVLEDKNVK